MPVTMIILPGLLINTRKQFHCLNFIAIQCSDCNGQDITYIARQPICTDKYRTEKE